MKKKIITLLTVLLIASCGVSSNKEIEGNKVIKADGAYYLVYNTTVIKLTDDTYITKDKKVGDYYNSKISNQEDDFLVDLKKYFPHGFNGIENGTTPEMYIDMPVLSLGDKNIIDSYKLAQDLSNKNPELLITQDITKENTEIVENNEANLTGKKIAILNANGKAGYARTVGEKLKADLGVEYTSENNSKSENFSYIINHKLTDVEIQKIIADLGLKYVKVLKDDTLKPEADAVIITGDDAKVVFNIEILSKSGNEEISKTLAGYTLNSKKETKYNNQDIKDETSIMYNSEDMYIARALKSLIPDANLVVDETLNNKIVITTK